MTAWQSLEAFRTGALSLTEFLSATARCPQHRDAFQTSCFREALLKAIAGILHAPDVFEPILETLMSEERVHVAVADMMAADAGQTPSQMVSWLVQLCDLLVKKDLACEMDERRHRLDMISEEVLGKNKALDSQVKESFELQRRLRMQASKIKDELQCQREAEEKIVEDLDAMEKAMKQEEADLRQQLEKLEAKKQAVRDSKQRSKQSMASLDCSIRELDGFYDARASRESEIQRLAATSKTQVVLVQSLCNSVFDALTRLSTSVPEGAQEKCIEEEEESNLFENGHVENIVSVQYAASANLVENGDAGELEESTPFWCPQPL